MTNELNSTIFNEESSQNSFLYSCLKPVPPYYVEPSKMCGGYISQISRDKARKKKRRNKRK